MTDETKNISFSKPRPWPFRGGAESIDRKQKVLKLRSQNDIELLVEENRKSGKQVKKETMKVN